jgi:hypothetical protein
MPWIKQVDAEIQLWNIAGQMISQVKVNQPRLQMNISSLPAGLYLVKIRGAISQGIKKVWKQ